MKTKLTILLTLFSLTGLAQKINPENRLYTLSHDSLFVHVAFTKLTNYNERKLSYLKYRGKTYRYRVLIFDPSLFWVEQSQNKKKIKFY